MPNTQFVYLFIDITSISIFFYIVDFKQNIFRKFWVTYVWCLFYFSFIYLFASDTHNLDHMYPIIICIHISC